HARHCDTAQPSGEAARAPRARASPEELRLPHPRSDRYNPKRAMLPRSRRARRRGPNENAPADVVDLDEASPWWRWYDTAISRPGEGENPSRTNVSIETCSKSAHF